MGDIHGSAEYRANLVAVMARRAMENLGKLTMLSREVGLDSDVSRTPGVPGIDLDDRWRCVAHSRGMAVIRLPLAASPKICLPLSGERSAFARRASHAIVLRRSSSLLASSLSARAPRCPIPPTGTPCSPRRRARPSISTPGAASRASTTTSPGPATTVAERFGVRVIHVKVSDTAEVVSRVLTEKAAGRDEGGAVDLVWINGENFAAMKREGPAAARAPGRRSCRTTASSTSRTSRRSRRDFTVPVDGLEAPWGMAKLVFFHDTARLAEPPTLGRGARRLDRGESRPLHLSAAAGFHRHDVPEAAPGRARARPGRASRSRRPTRTSRRRRRRSSPGSTRRSRTSGASGRAFPRDYGSLRRLLADGEVDIAFAFNPVRRVERDRQRRAAGHGAQLRLRRRHARQHAFRGDPLQRQRRRRRDGARRFPDVAGGAGAQAGPGGLGRSDGARGRQACRRRTARASPRSISASRRCRRRSSARRLPEPHPSWVERIEHEWARRYGVNQ